ncbi:sulfatase-like hydrolase/transferase [Paraglaciecola aquimarina]|uniref:Sulfatase-like hydrolase/transferase n=1 Tax=Paraglaciecola aquimarina TaxID=1235557 RepID=A0ABU3STD7_9ALTE|nr:sulfatase-like hydrolase/transferase [Paraglaciecola aquimarina]MDU0353279.1 sulfatase-like hydrolase/transferase [Paraglaciecola aquimarina]
MTNAKNVRMNNKIKFVSILSLLTIITACSINLDEKPKTTSKRPNVLFIMSDDHAYQAISAYDNTLINTPNIDRLAKEGMMFTNASVTNAICAPSRATILTGKHTHINGKIDNLTPFDTSQVTFPQLFKEAGYQTAMFGKLHFGNNPTGVDDFMILQGKEIISTPNLSLNKGAPR